uniref:Alpha-1,6-mannosyl-glycoprotein 2-beta-N-acetylglucosaminyltransferase n=1 Tax=Culicoides sonorensis TaxID=179676 RepID=A0A336MCB3_CULSO
MRSRKIPIALPYTGTFTRRRHTVYIRIGVILFLVIFAFLQISIFNDSNDLTTIDVTNDSAAAILSMVPPVLHKYLKSKTRNNTHGTNNTHNGINESSRAANISEIKMMISRYNEAQLVLNEDLYGPLQNNSVIIVVQVHKRIKYLRHLIISLAQARDISKTLLVFSHDYYDEEINDLVQSIDFCKVIQIFYPYSIQTHPNEFPGADPNDCPRDMKKDEALSINCNNALYPDLYGHYREASFSQTKHHWFWKANTVFDGLEVTKYHTGLVVFLEEDHYVAEDFLYVLNLMQQKARESCAKCNILSLGTYLKTFNYYTYSSKKHSNSNKNNNNKKALFGHHSTSLVHNHNHPPPHDKSDKSASSHGYTEFKNKNKPKTNNNHNNPINYNHNNNNHNFAKITNNNNEIINNNNNNNIGDGIGDYVNDNEQQNSQQHKRNNKLASSSQAQWSFQVMPSLYSLYQKAELTPWISSKHNMGMALNQSTWRDIKQCAIHFCNYDDYNWDWSLQHLSQQCLEHKLYAMVVKGPRVFHIGECGVHHKKNNCESNQVISKVQQVIHIATKAGQLYPKSITLTMPSVTKKTKLRKGNGGWGDKRDHLLCMNMTHTALR